MTGAGPEPGSLEHTLLGTRRWPGAAVVAVVLRSVRWPYSCGLAAAVRESAHRYADAGAELHVTVDEPLDRRTAAMAAWGLSPPLPAALAEPLARAVGSWDPALARADDGLGVLGPDGRWVGRWALTDPFGDHDVGDVLPALCALGLGPVPRTEFPAPARARAPGVCDPADAARALRRARHSAGRAATLMDGSVAGQRSRRAGRRFARYVAALEGVPVEDAGPSGGGGGQRCSSAPRPGGTLPPVDGTTVRHGPAS